MTGNELHTLFKARRESEDFTSALRVRLHRAVSWVKSAEKYEQDEDIAFSSYWIAFNACYAQNGISRDETERHKLKQFLNKLIQHDTEQHIYHCLWYNYSDYIRGLVNNHYLFPLFWESLHNPKIDWKPRFEHSKKQAFQALANNETQYLLGIAFDRLYTLRNQIIHGGATYQSSINRQQLRDSVAFMKNIMPFIIQIIIENPAVDWGKIFYPPVEV